MQLRSRPIQAVHSKSVHLFVLSRPDSSEYADLMNCSLLPSYALRHSCMVLQSYSKVKTDFDGDPDGETDPPPLVLKPRKLADFWANVGLGRTRRGAVPRGLPFVR